MPGGPVSAVADSTAGGKKAGFAGTEGILPLGAL